MYGRSTGRDVHIYSAKDTNTVLGGLRLTDSITKANFYSMVEIVFIFDNDYTLCSESGTTVKRDDNPLQPGKYLIRTVGSLMVNNEPWLARTGNVPPETSNPEFRHAVRKRDRGCVITGQRAIYGAHGFWTAYKATRIFPLEHTEHWVNHGYDRWITTATSGASINSVQNGVLLRLDIRALFEVYLVSINPDVSPQACSTESQPLTVFLGQLQDRLLRVG